MHENDAQPSAITVADGRSLAWAEYGASDGAPVFVFHGTPGSRLDHDLFGTAVPARIISPDRPGYGGSDPQPERRLTDWPADVVALADHLGLDRFSVVGISGGGPHALACAASIVDRLDGVATICGVGPLDRPGATEGMNPMNVMMSDAARQDPDALVPIGDMMAAAINGDVDAFLQQFSAALPEIDQKTIAMPEVRDMFVASMREAFRQGGRAMAREMHLFASQWGFDLGAIDVPVEIWQGTVDTNVPLAHAQYLADTLPKATLHTLEGEGHLSLAVTHSPRIISELVV